MTSLEYIGTHEHWDSRNHYGYCSGHSGLFELRARGCGLRIFFSRIGDYVVLLHPYQHNSSYAEENREMDKADVTHSWLKSL